MKKEVWPEITYENWVKKIEKELKTESIETFDKKLFDSFTYNPFFNFTSTQLNTSEILNFPVFCIGIAFNLPAEEANKAIQHLLAYDLRAISLKYENEPQISKSLEGVFLDMIFVDLKFANQPDINSFLRKQKERALNIAIPATEISFDDDILHFVDYDFLEENPIQILHNCKKMWREDRLSGDKKRYKISCPISENLLETIPFFRSLRILFESLVPDGELIIEARSAIIETTEDENTALIKAGAIAMNARMAGVNHLYFGALDALEKLNYYTTILNIQNIMALESKMDVIEDPLKGSYAIEKITSELLALV